ncbi:DNA polymerase III subunit chi [Neiella sp. HB171785]|uniref:DNA polymerase III subunit chi n=1 Tax=Neiella litorisoli TaxID=2771431 RepID=A0A8J6UE26_9GAMM|nr:DNA polymerase III subunit chi [Neiella litorisoli]MBD1389114.1 DNA polymerase III subunit chi [Neiella litorisoli]
MAASAHFVLMDQANNEEQTEGSAPFALAEHFILAAKLCANYQQRGLKLHVLVDSQEQAELIDDQLFAAPLEQFVAHAQSQFAPRYGAPVMISTSEPTNFVPLLINLSAKGPSNTVKCRHILDLVPTEPDLKQQARDRYRLYQSYGLAPTTGSEQQLPAFN